MCWWCKVVCWSWWWSDFRSSPACICNFQFKGTGTMHDHNLTLIKSNVSEALKWNIIPLKILSIVTIPVCCVYVFHFSYNDVKFLSKKFRLHSYIFVGECILHTLRHKLGAVTVQWLLQFTFVCIKQVSWFNYFSFCVFWRNVFMCIGSLLHILWDHITFRSMVFLKFVQYLI
jgi:hypothetical protein